MVQPTPEVDAFIGRIEALSTGPSISLDAALQPSLNEEAEHRKLFATDRHNTRIANPYVGLVDVFAAPEVIRTTRARVVARKEDLSAKYVMPIVDNNRRQEGSPSMVADLEEFKKNWAIFTEGSLVQLIDWSNVVAAGGSVLACLTPLSEAQKATRRTIRKYYLSQAFSTSDIDLFLWGLNKEQAEAKIKQIYEAVQNSVPWDVTCIRTKHTISIHCQYPSRPVQIILRLYHSPAEILAGFDIDAPCCAYDGKTVWANPRAIVAMMRQCNTVDMTRRSPSYEVRLAKYSERSYEVYIPTLARDKIDPTIFERNIAKIKGLARLLVLEKLKNDDMRTSFLRERRVLRARPESSYRAIRHNRRKYKGDLKQETGISLEMNDYDVTSLHIPYGPGWDARRIEKLVYQTDLGMNSTFNPKNEGRRLHRHPAFFGTIEEVLEDCCEHCPIPIDDDERELQKKEDETYIRGRIQFIEENPGRQIMTGSFNPIDEGEWSEQAYIKPAAKLFQAVVSYNRAALQKLLNDEGEVIVHERDHVGRTALHVAIMVKAPDIAEDLIDAGARITAKLADGRTPLHLAAQYDLARVIEKLLERSQRNKLELNKGNDKEISGGIGATPERPSSEDDWSSHDDEDVVMSASEGDDENDGGSSNDNDHDSDGEGNRATNEPGADDKAQAEQDNVLEEETDEPDVIDINTHDWDFGFTPLCYAVLFGNMPTIGVLLAAGADVKLPTNPSAGNSYVSTPFHPLTLCLIRKDDNDACSTIECLLKAGATSTTADEQIRTIFHIFVSVGRTRLVDSILRHDQNISTVINLPYLLNRTVMFPVVTAVEKRNYATLVLLLAHGARLELQEADVTKALDVATQKVRKLVCGYSEVQNYLQFAYAPLEVALKVYDDIAQLLIALGASINFGLKKSLEQYSIESDRCTVRDWVDYAVQAISDKIEAGEMEKHPKVPEAQPPESFGTGWMGFLRAYERSLKVPRNSDEVSEESSLELERKQDELQDLRLVRTLLLEVQAALSERKAKTWNEIYPDVKSFRIKESQSQDEDFDPPAAKREFNYVYLSNEYEYNSRGVPEHLLEAYDELYEACFAGHNEKIQSLCLPDPEAAAIPGTPSSLNISLRQVNKAAPRYNTSGYTPLFAAIANKRWSTAKLILAIATAQYCPEKNEEKIKFDSNDIDIDSDTESVDSDDSDMTIEQEKVVFVDIATRPSKVTSNVHPKQLLNSTISWRRQQSLNSEYPPDEAEAGTATPIVWAIVQHDLEAFVHIANLYQCLPKPLPLPDILDDILKQDQVEVLDEYIRRTGNGIDVSVAQKSSDTGPVPVTTNDENRIYLGLNVHGKKRKDLAKKNDPNAANTDENVVHPLLWRAIRAKASAVVSYLSSDRPLAAYRQYASTNSESKAIWIKRLGINELEKWLPSWLGWTSNALGESPLSAAVLSGDIEMIKLVGKLITRSERGALNLTFPGSRIKFLGFNLLLLAIRTSEDVEIMDYLLSRNVSPSHRDARGWNIYHFICSANKVKLLKYFLEKLPRDLNESLLEQTSRLRRKTPLYIAVNHGYQTIVSILLDYSKCGLMVRDVDGQTPLHCAVSRKFAATAKRLLLDLPREGLLMENGVGNTPMEVVSLLELVRNVEELRSYTQKEWWYDRDDLTPRTFNFEKQRVPAEKIPKYEAELKDLRDVVEIMVNGGVVPDEEKKKLKNEVMKWVNRMEDIVDSAKKMEAARKVQKEKAAEKQRRHKSPFKSNSYPGDVADISETFAIVKEAFESKDSKSDLDIRQLIHLDDVQASVGFSLVHVMSDENGNRVLSYGSTRCRRSRYGRQDCGDEDGSDDDEVKARRGSMVFQAVGSAWDEDSDYSETEGAGDF